MPVVRAALAVYWLTLIVATHWPGLTKEDVPDLGWLPFDKTMHVIAFAGLAALLTWSWFRRGRGAASNAVFAVVVGLIYGGLEELTQPYFGRTAALDDLVADLIGLIAGAGFAWGVLRMLRPRGEDEISLANKHPEVENNSGGEGFVGHAALISGLTLVSRLTGLVRDAVLAAVFGASLWLDAFLIGFLVPNLFRRLFGEGALTAAFIPRYTKLLQDDPALARRFASLCVVVLTTLLAGVTLVGEAALGLALNYAEGEKAHAALRLTMWMLPYMPMVCGVAFLGAILQVHRRFGPPAAAPVLLNLVMIGAAATLGLASADEPAGRSAATWVAGSVLVAGLLQLLWMGGAVFRRAPLTAAFAGTRATFRDMLRTMLPMVIGLGVFQINTLLDGLIAYTLAAPPPEVPPEIGNSAAPVAPETFTLLGHTLAYPMETGAVTTLTLAQRLYQFPLGVFGIAIATAIFPALAAAAASRSAKPHGTSDGGSGDGFSDILRRGLRLTFFIGLPASVGLILVRVPLTRVFFEWNAFTADDAVRCAAVLAGYAAAVWAYSMTHVVTRAYYALDDAITPLKVSAGMVGFNLALNLTLIWPLGVAGLAWSTAISASLQVVLLLWLLRRRVDRPVDADVRAGWLRTAGLTLVMGLGVAAALWGFDPVTLSKARCVGVLALGVGVGAAIYLGGAAVVRAPELRWLIRRG